MELNQKKSASKITFKNQPKLSTHEVDQKYNERRIKLVPEIEQLLSSGKLSEFFKDKNIRIEFSHVGVSSLLSFIEVEDKKYVLKIPLHPTLEGEALFLQEWEKAGVSVPHVYKEGHIGEHSYTLMQHINAPLLMDVMRKSPVEESLLRDIGKTLAKIHTSKAQGYGRIKNSKPEFDTFKEWILSDDIAKRVTAVKEENLLGDEHGSFKEVVDILTEHVEKEISSTYCHFDYGASNILATQPLTVIDPDPMLNNGIIDVARSFVLEISEGYTGQYLKEGYFSENKKYNERVFHAAIILNAYYKFPYWHKKNKERQIKNVQDYLVKTRHLL